MLANNVPSSRDLLLQRPEAQGIIQGLQQGEITIHYLIQQLQMRLNLKELNQQVIEICLFIILIFFAEPSDAATSS